MSEATILVIEDDEEIAELVSMYLRKHDFQVRVAFDQGVFEIVKKEHVDLVLLDVLLPDTDGFAMCRELRKMTDVPILFTSCKAEDADKVLALGLGGDDYIVKPFSPSELVARVQSHLRRYRSIHSGTDLKHTLVFDGLEIDGLHLLVRARGKIIRLSTKEFQILMLLAQHPERAFSSEELFHAVWNTPSLGDYRTVMVHISNLRRKIEVNPAVPQYIITIKGTGYQFSGGKR